MRVGCLVDTTRCMGCRSCQVACKQSNALGVEKSKFFAAPGGYQNPKRFTASTFTFISFHETETTDGRTSWTFVKRQCMHCKTMYCAYACAPEVFRKTDSGVIAYQADKCIGCAACIDACPFDVPVIEYWNLRTPHIRKCGFCLSRQESKPGVDIQGERLSNAARGRYRESLQTPACAKACPTGTLQFGDRDALLVEARRRIAAEPKQYVNHIYGEKEAGGLGWLYLSSVPFEQLGFPSVFDHPGMFEPSQDFGALPAREGPFASITATLSSMVAGLAWFFRRRNEVRESANSANSANSAKKSR